MRSLTNRQRVVYDLLADGVERTAQDVADAIEAATLCGVCQGTGEGDGYRGQCARCFGRGQARYHYSEAYVDLRALLARGLVSRRHPVNEWGDELRTFVYKTTGVPIPVPDDPLEALWNAE